MIEGIAGALRALVVAGRDRPHNVRAVVVGELNPYGTRTEYALFPNPPNCAGHRLCHRILGMSAEDYLIDFERRNLCVARWSTPASRVAARDLRQVWDAFDVDRAAAGTLPHAWGTPFVLLGRKVAAAFDAGAPLTVQRDGARGRLLVVLPHPSGLCRVWTQQHDAIDRARALLRSVGALPLPPAPGSVVAASPVRCATCGEFTDSGRVDDCQHCGRA